MASTPLALVDENLTAVLQRHALTQVGDVMGLSVVDLMEILGVTEAHAHAIKVSAAQQAAPRPVTAAALYQASHAASHLRVPCGLPHLDQALRGGLPLGAITEVVGPSGVGKTQLCMGATLLATAPRPWGMQRPVIYIDTERKFSGDRLWGMARARWIRAGSGQGAQQPMSEEQLSGILQRVLVQQPKDTEQLLRCLHSLSAAVAARKVALVVLDSVAALVRGSSSEGGGGGGHKAALRSRAEVLGQAAAMLKSLAEQQRIPVLVSNQVTARMTGAHSHNLPGSGVARGTRLQEAVLAEGAVGAALGTAWAHSVNVRLLLERRGNERVLQLVKSPASGNVGMVCDVTGEGLKQVAGVAAWDAPQGNVLDQSMANYRSDNVDCDIT